MNGRQFSSNFLGQSFQSKYLEASFHCIVRSYKIELSSIVQQTSSEFVVYESIIPILRTNEASKRGLDSNRVCSGLLSLSFLLQRRNQQSGWRGFCLHFGFCCRCCFGRHPRLQGPLYIFCLGAISDKVVRTLTDEAALLLLFINLDGPGHPYCESPFSVIRFTRKSGM